MAIFHKMLIMSTVLCGVFFIITPKDTVRLSIKNKKKCDGTHNFMQPMFIDDQYFNVLEDDSYDSWEPIRLMRDSAALFTYTKLWAKSFDSKELKAWHKPSKPIHASVSPAITWIGHSTVLIQWNNINIITDPIFGSPSWFYTRSIKPGLTPNRLPHIDIILLSHNHLDHMDEDSLMQLRSHQPFVMVPLGNSHWFKEHGFNYVSEYTWWENQEIVLKIDSSLSLTITCVPAFHWSGRTVTDTNATLWAGWVIKSGDTVLYFAGDTGYNKRLFDEIHTVFPTVSLALLPIGPNEPSRLMNNIHLSAEQAVEAFVDLEASWFIPMHWGTFHFGIDTFMQPIERVKKAWQENNLSQEKLHILKFGQQVTYMC